MGDVACNLPTIHFNGLSVLTRCTLYLFGCPSTALSMPAKKDAVSIVNATQRDDLRNYITFFLTNTYEIFPSACPLRFRKIPGHLDLIKMAFRFQINLSLSKFPGI